MRLADVPKKQIKIALVILAGGLVLAALIGFLGAKNLGAPVVDSFEPANGQENFLGETPLTVTFKEDLTEKQQKLVYFEFQPETFFTTNWNSSKQLETNLTPTALRMSTTYTVRVLYQKKVIYTSSFQTPNITEEQLTKDLTEQAEGDRLFADAQTDWYKDNPWYSQLPIVTSGYTIVYEPDTKKFRIRITLGDEAVGTQIGDAKERAVENLRGIGVNLNKYSYYFIEE